MPIILSAPAKRKNARKTSGGFDLYFGTPSSQTWAGTFATREQARYKADELLGEYGEPSHGVHIVAARAPAKRKNARRAALPPMRNNGSRSVVDAVAARELELYVENEASLIGPGNTLGANVMRMLAARIVRGTYDNTKAWKAWSPLVAEGAKRYKREIGPINASKATRDAVATRLSEAFEGAVRSGGLDPMKLLGARRNPGFASHPFGWAKVQSGRVVKLSTAQRKPAGTGWGAVETSTTQIGDRAYLDGGTVYLR